MQILESLNHIADELDSMGNYKLADKITQTMVRLSQFDPNDVQNTSAKKFTPVSADASAMDYSNLKGTSFYNNLPYYQSQEYQYDMMHPQWTPEQLAAMWNNPNVQSMIGMREGENEEPMDLGSFISGNKNPQNQWDVSQLYQAQQRAQQRAQYNQQYDPYAVQY